MKTLTEEDLKRTANTIRGLSMDGVQAANSGHPGMPMGMADVAAVLWLKHHKQYAKDPAWPDRDRFVLSGGHGSILLYSLLHLAGYDLPIEELKNFRQWDSKTPGHPEYGHTEGVETTTGPLGQGCANAVGMAIAERMLAERFNTDDIRPVDHHTYVFCGDGDLMEGLSHEAFSLAGHLKLNKLILFFDSNRITIEGSTELACSDDFKKRFQSYNWGVIEIDGHDYGQIDKAIRKAKRSKDKPTVVICKTHIGKGSPNKQDTASAHGEPLGPDEVTASKKNLGLPADQAFHVTDEVREAFTQRFGQMKRKAGKWKREFARYSAENPEKAELWTRHMDDVLPDDIENVLPSFDPAKPIATRAASGKVIQSLADALPQLIGGSADLSPSNKTMIDDAGDIAPGAFSGRNFHFGVREHAMGSVMNGITLHGGFRIFGGTFFVFSDYCRPAIRLAAIMKLPVIYVFTHDSFYVGEDGSTHEPVEHMAALRCIPNVTVIRPADPTETGAAWVAALKNTTGPTVLLLTRQGLNILNREEYPAASNLGKGAYTLWQSGEGTPDLIIIGSGSEVEISLEAAKGLTDRNVRVVSMPSWELFDAQDQAYRDEVLPPVCTNRIAVEAGVSQGWEKHIGTAGKTLCLDRFGASAPYKELARQFGFTADNLTALIGSFPKGCE